MPHARRAVAATECRAEVPARVLNGAFASGCDATNVAGGRVEAGDTAPRESAGCVRLGEVGRAEADLANAAQTQGHRHDQDAAQERPDRFDRAYRSPPRRTHNGVRPKACATRWQPDRSPPWRTRAAQARLTPGRSSDQRNRCAAGLDAKRALHALCKLTRDGRH